jgi:hypothetical protein
MAPEDPSPRPDLDDDTDYDYYDTPCGNQWLPGSEPARASGEHLRNEEREQTSERLSDDR